MLEVAFPGFGDIGAGNRRISLWFGVASRSKKRQVCGLRAARPNVEDRGELIKSEGPAYVVKATGSKGDSTAVSGRLIIDCQKNADGQPDVIDQLAAKYIRELAEQLQGAAIVRR